MTIHQNSKTEWTTIEFEQESMLTVFVIETDLTLNFEDPAYDKAKVDSLLDATHKFFESKKGHIDRVRIVQIRNG